ncbi:efflux pump antibiotic resistance protein [Apiospora arundinis]
MSSPTPQPVDEREKLAAPAASDGSNAEEQRAKSIEGSITGARWFIVNVAVLSATFLYALDNTVTANVRPAMAETFGNRIDMLPWLSVAYPMGEVGANPLWGKLNGQFEKKCLFLAAVLIFEIGSAVIGSAQSIEAVVAGRAIAGFGGSGIYVGTINILSALTTPVERNQSLNNVGIAWSLGTILGPIIGGAFADSAATWRWAFYINLCLAVLTIPPSIWLVPTLVPATSLGLVKRIKQVDYLGAILFIGGTVTTVMILGFGGAVYDWNSGQMIGLYVAAVVLWIAFALQQRFYWLTVDRIFPVQLFGNWLTVALFIWTAIAISDIVVTIYSLPLFFQFAFGETSLRSAVYILAFVLPAIAGAGSSGVLLAKFPYYKAWFFWASALMLIGNGLLSTISYETSRGAVCGYSVIVGLGVGPVIQLGFTVAQQKNRRTTTSDISAFCSCAQMGGLALSLGLATTVFLDRATGALSAILPDLSRTAIQESINGANTGLLESLDADVRLLVLQAIAHSVGTVFYLNMAGAALGLLIAIPMKFERLDFSQ